MPVVDVRGLTKRFGGVTAVDDVSFTAQPGRVTGFLGPNGAGKTTTLRMLLGLVHPTAGTATIDGRPYADLPDPTRTVGAVLEAAGFHPGRRAHESLRATAAAAGLPRRRVDEVLAQVGLTEVADRRVGGFSLGMRQRLGLAAAMLGDPALLLLDEPANGLDPEGIRWLRGFLRHLAGSGRTVVISSHVLSEVAQTVDDVVIMTEGRLVRAGSVADLLAETGEHVRVGATDSTALRAALERADMAVTREERSDTAALRVEDVSAAQVGEAAFRAGVALHELVTVRRSLEDVFLDLTRLAEGSRPAAEASGSGRHWGAGQPWAQEVPDEAGSTGDTAAADKPGLPDEPALPDKPGLPDEAAR